MKSMSFDAQAKIVTLVEELLDESLDERKGNVSCEVPHKGDAVVQRAMISSCTVFFCSSDGAIWFPDANYNATMYSVS